MPKSLRTLARGQSCYLRLAGCSHDPEKTVLCHLRRGGVGGMGLKPDDLLALPCDDHCHSIIDRRVGSDYTREELDSEILRGYLQWMSFLIKQEIVVIVL